MDGVEPGVRVRNGRRSSPAPAEPAADQGVRRHDCSLARVLSRRSGRGSHSESHFGHEIGVDRELLDWDKVVSYFRALEQSSDEIRVEELGKTVEGRPFIAATIAEPETLRNLDRYREIQRRLADPRITTGSRTPRS